MAFKPKPKTGKAKSTGGKKPPVDWSGFAFPKGPKPKSKKGKKPPTKKG